MTEDTQKSKRGRPRKVDTPPRINVSDASQAQLSIYMYAIERVMLDVPILANWLAHAEPSVKEDLISDLAYEVAFYPAFVGTVKDSAPKRRGPKPKTAQAILLTQVRNILAKVGIKLLQWKNGWGQRTDLTDFCGQLIAISGNQERTVSSRTWENAPEIGWEPLP